MEFSENSFKPSINQGTPCIKRWTKLVGRVLRKSDSSDPQKSFIIIRICKFMYFVQSASHFSKFEGLFGRK